MNKVFVKTKHSTYNIYIEDHLIENIDAYLETQKQYIIISDDFIPKTYAQTVSLKIPVVKSYYFKHGESSKTLETAYSIMTSMINDGITKDITIIALGGGVVGDLAGFIASIYMRGVDYIQIPTTLLAQVDSSVGGKTAVNTPSMKNAIGAFKQPKLVLIDPLTLNTLEERQFNNGMAEVIKYGLIADKNLYEDLFDKDNVKQNIDHIIATCVAIKAKIVQIDEYDSSIRRLLNFGHTIGHAIEQHSQYDLLHGEAISIGMALMAKNESYYSTLLKLLKLYDLPHSNHYDIESLYQIIKTDKKATKDDLNIVLVKEIGDAFIKTIHKNNILEYLE
jgi:3-dehydroquinate synthase